MGEGEGKGWGEGEGEDEGWGRGEGERWRRGLEAGLEHRVDGAVHAGERVSPSEAREGGGVERVERDVEPVEARRLHALHVAFTCAQARLGAAEAQPACLSRCAWVTCTCTCTCHLHAKGRSTPRGVAR